LPDKDLDANQKILDDLNLIALQVDQELHQVESEVHHIRSELELERKKWECALKDVVKEATQHEDQIEHLKRNLKIAKQINEEEIEHMHKQLENMELKAEMSEKMAKVRAEELQRLKEAIQVAEAEA
jgi:predicted  nucleic acid-binding Zn-ribbon protein